MSTQFELAEAYTQLTVHGENKFASTMKRVRGQVETVGKSMDVMARTAQRMLLVGTGAMTLFVKMGADADQQYRKLQSVLTATGGAAGFTADELKKMAGDLQKVTAFEDDATVGAMAVLATFKSIKGDIFKRAITGAQDMATVMGTDLPSAVRTLGMALDNPAEGMTRLQRAGVSFSDSQKETIKSLVESGQVTKAQTVILDELASKFGGAALANGKTFTGQMTILKNKLGDLAEEIGSALFPVLTRLSGKLGELSDRVGTLSATQKDSVASWTIFGGSLLAIAATIPKVTTGIKGMLDMIILLGGRLLMAGPIALLIGGLSLLGAAWLTAKAKGEDFGETVLGLTEDITGLEMAQKKYREMQEGEKGFSDRERGVAAGKPDDIKRTIDKMKEERAAKVAEMGGMVELEGRMVSRNTSQDKQLEYDTLNIDVNRLDAAILRYSDMIEGANAQKSSNAWADRNTAMASKLAGMMPNWMTGAKANDIKDTAPGRGASALGQWIGGGMGGLSDMLGGGAKSTKGLGVGIAKAMADGMRKNDKDVIESFANAPLEGIMERLKKMRDEEERAAFQRMKPTDQMKALSGADEKTVARLLGMAEPKDRKTSNSVERVAFSELNAKLQEMANSKSDEQLKISRDNLKETGNVVKAIQNLPSQMPQVQFAWQ
jgi:hypothetical protein